MNVGFLLWWHEPPVAAISRPRESLKNAPVTHGGFPWGAIQPAAKHCFTHRVTGGSLERKIGGWLAR